MLTLSQVTNGKQPPSKWGAAAKFLTVFLPMITALVTSVVALNETRNKAREKDSKAAHDELVSKIKALNKDLEALEKKLDEQTLELVQQVKFGVASAKSQADSVRALFTGYALASRGRGQGRTVEKVKEIVKRSQDRTRALIRSAPSNPKPPPEKRSFKSPKSWKQIQQQVQEQYPFEDR